MTYVRVYADNLSLMAQLGLLPPRRQHAVDLLDEGPHQHLIELQELGVRASSPGGRATNLST